MPSITTMQPVRMPLIYSTACTLSSESKQRSQVNDTYCDLWQLLGRVCLFLGFLSSLFPFSLPPLLTTARYRLDQCWLPWLLEGECVTWQGGKAKAGGGPSSLQCHWFTKKILPVKTQWASWGGGCGDLRLSLTDSTVCTRLTCTKCTNSRLPGYKNNTPTRWPGIPAPSQVWQLDPLAMSRHSCREGLF